MKIGRIQFDPVPQPIAGVLTIKCACGWEMVFIQPEEDIVLMHVVFHHLQVEHHLEIPELCCFWH